MSTTSTTSASAGVQQLYNDGLLPSNLSSSALTNASTSQLNKIATSTIAGQEVSALLGIGSDATDSASLSNTAMNALLQEINPSSTSNSTSSTDPLTAAVDNALTSNLNAAVAQYGTPSTSTSGANVNVVG